MSTEWTNQLLKKAVFLNENDRIGLFIFIPFDHKSCQSYQIGRKYQRLLRVCGILNFFLAYLKPNCNKVLLFVITKEFHKWPNANEKIFSNPVKKNSICGFHGQSREKLKWWSTFKKYNEQMVSDTQKFYCCSSSNVQICCVVCYCFDFWKYIFQVNKKEILQ